MKSLAQIATVIALLMMTGPACDRLKNSSNSAPATADWPRISVFRHVTGLDRPVHITNAADGSRRMFVVEQRGRIIEVRGNAPLKESFLDIAGRVSCCGERGLLSVAFPPDYTAKRHVYVYYTDINGDTVVARYRSGGDGGAPDPESEEILLTVSQPFPNHNGGQLAFGPDGYLYIGTGDGGAGGDPLENGQKAGARLGKILRIDVESSDSPYGIPGDNPYLVLRGYRPDIWALGLRNPWRFSFDRQTGDLYIADVGQDRYEEINFQPAASQGGENYGWNIMEGTRCFKPAPCDKTGLAMPVAEYDHSRGCSVTGGFVYRGREFPEMQGIYFYGDYCSGRIWGLRRSGMTWETAELLDTDLSISTFGEDEEGNLYIADHETGSIYRLESR